MELAPCQQHSLQAGCQGFFGPFPSAFLDKFPIAIGRIKNCGKDKRENELPAKIFYNAGNKIKG